MNTKEETAETIKRVCNLSTRLDFSPRTVFDLLYHPETGLFATDQLFCDLLQPQQRDLALNASERIMTEMIPFEPLVQTFTRFVHMATETGIDLRQHIYQNLFTCAMETQTYIPHIQQEIDAILSLHHMVMRETCHIWTPITL